MRNDVKHIIVEEIQKIYDAVQAWHGSPYDFDNFDAEHMGSGEGAQMFGWGLYFTDAENIAKEYAEVLSKIKYGGNKELIQSYINSTMDFINNPDRYKDWEFRVYEDKNYGYFVNTSNNYHGYKVVLDNASYQQALPYMKERVGNLQKAYGEYDDGKRLYQVTLHKGKTPEQYHWLIWDKPIDKNINPKIIAQAQKENVLIKWNNRLVISSVKTGQHFITDDISGEDLYKNLTTAFGDEKQASLFLLRAGIDGIKYPANSIVGGTTSDNADHFNYVVFDPNAISIENKNRI